MKILWWFLPWRWKARRQAQFDLEFQQAKEIAAQASATATTVTMTAITAVYEARVADLLGIIDKQFTTIKTWEDMYSAQKADLEDGNAAVAAAMRRCGYEVVPTETPLSRMN